MTRGVPEWIGKTDDSAIPLRVKLRVHEKSEGMCSVCSLEASSGQYDHIVPLILGGPNRESNLQLICVPCHRAKTRLDVKLKAKVARVRQRHLGIRKPSRFPGSRDSGFKRKMNGTVERR